MLEDSNTNTNFQEITPRYSEWKRFLKVFLGRKIVIFGTIVIVVAILSAVFAPMIAPYNPYETNLSNVLAKPSQDHLLGTDSLGRDTLSRIMYGARTSLMIGLMVICLAASLGVTLGLIAGFFGGLVYLIIMRFIDALMSFPMILTAIIIAALLGTGMTNVILALGVGMMSVYTRLMCGQVLIIKQNDYIMAARVTGASNFRTMTLHILPNALPPLIVLMTMMIGTAILAEAGLSFLGLGIAPPGASWGAMVNDGYQHILTNPVLAFAPGFAIMMVVFAFNMVGDGLRDALDPRLRGVI